MRSAIAVGMPARLSPFASTFLTPLVQGKGKTAKLCRFRPDCMPARPVLPHAIDDRPQRAVTQFAREDLLIILPMLLLPARQLQPPGKNVAGPSTFGAVARRGPGVTA
jgi:hypothetical protein